MARPKYLGHPLQLSWAHWQGAGLDMEQLKPHSLLLWDASTADGSLTHCAQITPKYKDFRPKLQHKDIHYLSESVTL